MLPIVSIPPLKERAPPLQEVVHSYTTGAPVASSRTKVVQSMLLYASPTVSVILIPPCTDANNNDSESPNNSTTVLRLRDQFTLISHWKSSVFTGVKYALNSTPLLSI